jgi:hypothetical protein
MISLDRLVLGTCKMGLPQYGYNSTSRPSAAESIAILRHAWRRGVRAYDTALGYGDALALLAYAGIPEPYITSKCRLPLLPPGWGQGGRSWLIHNPTEIEMSRGLIPATCGVSVYTVAEVEAARRLGITPIQAPASCLNPAVDVEYGRAPFLQGVLLRRPSLAPPGLRDAVEVFQEIASRARLSPVVLALHAAYGERLVVGVSSLAQLDAVLDACRQPAPPGEVIAAARALAATVDATAALPSLWSTP